MKRYFSFSKKFQISPSRNSWFDGQLECEVLGANLVMIDDKAENRYIADKAKDIQDNLWIGLSEVVIAQLVFKI